MSYIDDYLKTMDINIGLSDIKLGNFLPPIESTIGILCAEDTVDWLKAQRLLIGWTFTLNENFAILLDIDRLIVGQPYQGNLGRIKLARGTHIKCYIGKHEMYIGSMNLTEPTIEDVGVIIPNKKQIAHMRKQFELCWKSL